MSVMWCRLYDFVLMNMQKDSYCFPVWKAIITYFRDKYAFTLLIILLVCVFFL